jgi:cation diffusion facilitator family transporter
MGSERGPDSTPLEVRGRDVSATLSVEVSDPEVRTMKRFAFGVFVVNLLLAGGKGALAHISGSLALKADALDSAADSVASLMIWIGLGLSTRKTRMFPYGLYKIENFMSVVVAVLILMVGVQIAREALYTTAAFPQVTWPVLAGMSASVLVSSILAYFAAVLGRRTHSPTLLAEGKHRLVDVLSSTVVLCSLVSNTFGLRVDRIAALVVLALILWAGLELLRDGMRVLLDASLDSKTMQRIRSILESHPKVASVRFLAGRNAGRYRFVETALALRTDNLTRAHRMTEEIEEAIRREIPHVERVLIHAEPNRPERILVTVPLADMHGKVSVHFGEAPFYAFVWLKTETGLEESHQVVANPFASIPKGKGVRVAEWLIDHKTDVVLVKEPLRGKGPGYALESAGVEVRVTKGNELSEALKSCVPAP